MARARHARSARKSLWLEFQPAETTIAGVGQTLVFSLNAAALALEPFTIIRTHFSVMVRSDQSAAVERQMGGFGIAVVSDQAVGVGITAVPHPVSDLGSSLWFLNQLLFSEANTVTDRTTPVRNYQLDSRAMRKVEVGSDIVVVVENISLGGSGGSIFTLGGRILIKTN